MRQELAIIAVERVDPLLVRVAGRAHESQAPFAESTGHVPGFLQVLEEGTCVRRERELPFRGQFHIAPDGGMAAVSAGNQAGTGRRAHRGA